MLIKYTSYEDLMFSIKWIIVLWIIYSMDNSSMDNG